MEVGILGLAGGAATTFITAWTTWFFSRKQAKAELGKLEEEIAKMRAERESEMKSAEVEIMEKYRELYTRMLDDVGKQLESMKADNTAIRLENSERREINQKMVLSMTAMEVESKSVKLELERVNAKLEAVTKELHQMKTDFPCADCPRRSA